MGKTEQSRLFESKIQPPLNNHRYIDKNIHETIERIQSYEIHQKKLIRIREELEKNKNRKANGDVSYQHLKSQMINNKLRSHEFSETEKINEIKKSNQILLDKLLDISKGKRCEVKQENISNILPQNKSLNYQVKKREAERIDYENQKIMERIVNQNASLSSKKMHQDYIEQLKYKRMKEQKLGVSIDKILEKKRKMVLEARSTILPLLNTKLNSPNDETEGMMGRNFNIGTTSIDAHSQRVINHNVSQDVINSAKMAVTADYNSGGNYQTVQNNRYANKSQLTKLSHSVTPKSQRQKRFAARSEMSDYKQGTQSMQQNNYRKPNKIVLESLNNQKQPKNATINTQVQSKQNKPPVAPVSQSKLLNKNDLTANQKKPIDLKQVPGTYYSHTNTQQNQQPLPLQQQIPKQHQQKDNSSNQSSSNQELTPKVNINHNMQVQDKQSQSSKQTFNQSSAQQKREEVDSDIDEGEEQQDKDQIIEDEILDEEVNQVNTNVKQIVKQGNVDVASDIDDYEDENFVDSSRNKTAVINKSQQQLSSNKLQVANSKSINNDLSVNDFKYLERNSIINDSNNQSNINNNLNNKPNSKPDDEDYEEEFEEEFVE